MMAPVNISDLAKSIALALMDPKCVIFEGPSELWGALSEERKIGFQRAAVAAVSEIGRALP